MPYFSDYSVMNIFYDSFRSNFDLKHNGGYFIAQVGTPIYDFCKIIAEGKNNKVEELQVVVFPPTRPAKDNLEWRDLKQLCMMKMSLEKFFEIKLRAPELKDAHFVVAATIEGIVGPRILYFEWFAMLRCIQNDLFVDFIRDEVNYQKRECAKRKREEGTFEDVATDALYAVESDQEGEHDRSHVAPLIDASQDRTVTYVGKSNFYNL